MAEKVGANALAFMFETAYLMKLTDYSISSENVDEEYYKCWENLVKHFDKDRKDWWCKSQKVFFDWF